MSDFTEGVVQLLGLPNFNLSGSASLSGESAVSATSLHIAVGSCAMSAQSSLGVNVVRITEGVALSSGQSDLTATALHEHVSSAALSSQTALVGNGGIIYGAASDMTGESACSASATYVRIAGTAGMSGQSSLPNVTPLPIYRLQLPTVEEAYTRHVLLQRYPIHVGRSLLITGTSGEFQQFVAQDAIAAADYYFGGGRHYQLNQTEYEAVDAAGFGDYVEVA